MSAKTIQVSSEHAGFWHVQNVLPESARKASEILNENHNNQHCFYNQLGEIFLHNHTTHHQLTLYACGATPEDLEQMYDSNLYYLKTMPPADEKVWKAYTDPRRFLLATGYHENYQNFLRFFEDAIERLGLEVFMKEYVFGESIVARQVFNHLFHGVFHPLIHFGYGLEFQQPAIIAEALAMGVVHFDYYMDSALAEAADVAQIVEPANSLLELVEEASMNETIIQSRTVMTWDKPKDGILVKGRRPAIDILARYQVQPTEADVRFRAAELMNISVYMNAAAQHPDKLHRFDFVLLHGPTSSIVLGGAMDIPWISWRDKARLLESSVRDLLIYFMSFASGRKLSLARYRELAPLEGGWDAAIARGIHYPDDGHTIKLLRALAYASRVSRAHDADPRFAVKQDDFLRIARGVLNSLNPAGGKVAMDTGESWVRGVGFDEAWSWVPAKGQPEAWRENDEEGAESMPPGISVAEWVTSWDAWCRSRNLPATTTT